MPGWRRALVAVFAVGVLTGCADREEPPAPPSTALSWPDERSSPGPTTGTGAEPVTGDHGQAQEFVIDWFAALNDAYRTGELRRVEALSQPDCTACADFVTRLATVTVPGNRAASDVFTVRPLPDDGTTAATEDDVAIVHFTYSVNAVELHQTSQSPGLGGVVDRTQPEPARQLRAALVRDESGWSMGEIGL